MRERQKRKEQMDLNVSTHIFKTDIYSTEVDSLLLLTQIPVKAMY